MYIYWGYGCGKFNELGWISSMLEEGAFGGMDQRIMALKTSGLPEKVLLKQPAGIDKETPRLEPKPIESVTEKTREFLEMVYILMIAMDMEYQKTRESSPSVIGNSLRLTGCIKTCTIMAISTGSEI